MPVIVEPLPVMYIGCFGNFQIEMGLLELMEYSESISGSEKKEKIQCVFHPLIFLSKWN
jgi:hypothetical protein